MFTKFSPVFNTASPQAAAISGLFLFVLIICGAILAIVIVLVLVSLIFFRAQPGQGEPQPRFGNRWLEITWTVIPIGIVLWLLVLTTRGLQKADPPGNRPPNLIVVGHQWWWEVRYAGTNVVTANEIHIPIGAKWWVNLESADVIHDFWVPALSRKMDVIPGLTNHLWLEASTSGTFSGTCAEYCGAEHAWMRFSVIVEPSDVFDKWLANQELLAALPTTDSAVAGGKTFSSMTCNNCHAIRGVSGPSDTAPDLTHFADRRTLGAGVLQNTQTNLYRWLKNPQSIKPDCLMPNLKLTDAEATDLSNYLESLK